MNPPCVGLLVPFSSLLLTLTISSVWAQSSQQNVHSSKAEGNSSLVNITIIPSTPRIIQGSVYGVNAEIENVSNQSLDLQLRTIQLAVEPELSPPGRACTWYYSAGVGGETPTTLLPGDVSTVSFDLGAEPQPEIDPVTRKPKEDPCPPSMSTRLLRSIDFVPGPYSFVLTGSFLSAPPPARISSRGKPDIPPPDLHHFSAKTTMQVSIDQLQTIIYAGFGGLFALLVTKFRNSDADQSRLFQAPLVSGSTFRGLVSKVGKAAGAFLLSSAVTVVASRLSTTQFPVKVSVDDFWGAVTVGFVSYFVGGKFIDKLSDSVAKPAR